MSSLRPLEKEQLEALFDMRRGYVLEFSNRTFAKFFAETVNVEIYSPRYEGNGSSKANRLRAFWELESDALVGKVVADLLDFWSYLNPNPSPVDQKNAEFGRTIAARLLGTPTSARASEDRFLDLDLSGVSLAKALTDHSLLSVLESRFAEAQRCLQSDAPLATIFLCGSILEGLLLGTAIANAKQFNDSPNSPKDRASNVKPFPDWRLAELIDIACEEGFIKLDVKKFSHSLRDFRNYIHPYAQFVARFDPDRHTAQICLQVLKAAIASLGGER